MRRSGSGADSDNRSNLYTMFSILGAGLCVLALLIVWVVFSPQEHSPDSTSKPSSRQAKKPAPAPEDTGPLMHRIMEQPGTERERASSGGGGSSNSGGSTRGPQDSGRSSKVIKTFSGEGYKKLPPFQIHGSWKMKWKAETVFFAAYLHDQKSGRLIETLGDERSRGTTNKQLGSGKYYLKVSCAGRWSIKIIQSG